MPPDFAVGVFAENNNLFALRLLVCKLLLSNIVELCTLAIVEYANRRRSTGSREYTNSRGHRGLRRLDTDVCGLKGRDGMYRDLESTTKESRAISEARWRVHKMSNARGVTLSG